MAKTMTVMGREYTYVGTNDEGDERWQWNRYAINLWHRADRSWQALASVSGCKLASISVFGNGATAEDALRDMLTTLKTITAQREALGALVAGALASVSGCNLASISMIAPEHHDMARNVAMWLRGHAQYPNPEPDVLAALPGWDDYVADEISGVGFARRIEAALVDCDVRSCEVCGREAQAMGTEARCVEHCSERVGQ